jgi:putative SOS response-associated peptidase YedK
MCGRYALFHPLDDLGPLFGTGPLPFEARYNIAPTQLVPIVRPHAGSGREMLAARWGLIPHWADPSGFKATLFNARSETAHEKPSFRDAVKRGRCLVPASGFYEWRQGESPKTPYFIGRSDGVPLAFAGLWSLNVKGGAPILSCTILTTRPNRLMAELHDRMPVILEGEQLDRWLDPSIRSGQALVDLYDPFPAEAMAAHPVGRNVNSPANDGPALIEPAAA